MRVRIRFSKLGKVRFTSHRDTARIWERALRRAELPVAYSEGFSPRPKLSFGLALSTGHESLGEYLDVDLADTVDVSSLPARLTPALPIGIDCVAGVALDEVGLEDCRWTPCYDCGACTGYGIEHIVASATPPAGGSQGTGQGLEWHSSVPVELGPKPVGVGT